MKLLIVVVLTVLTVIFGCHAITVSNKNGRDSPSCGNKNTPPCKTIEYAVARTQPGKCKLIIDGGNSADGLPTAIYLINRTILAVDDFTMTNMENTSKPIIRISSYATQQQQQRRHTSQFFLMAKSQQRQVLHFTNIVFRGMAIVNVTTNETEIYISNCNVVSSLVPVVNSDVKHLKTKQFISRTFYENCAGLTKFEELSEGQFIVTDCNFTADHYSSIYTGFQVTNVRSRLLIAFKNVIFESIRKPMEVHISSTGDRTDSVTVVDSLFKWNVYPVNVTGCNKVIFQNTKFLENNKGALQLTEVTYVYLNQINFIRNTRRSAVNFITNNLVLINCSTFYDNSDDYQGGAIFGYDSRIVIQYSIFEHNSAPLSGGTIYHAASILSCCQLDLKNVTMRSAPEKSSRSGTLLSSSQKVKITNFIGKLEKDERPFIGAYIDGMVSSHSLVVVKQGEFLLTCPVNSNPEVIKAKYISRSGIVVTPSGAESMGCRKCPKQTYSLQSTTVKTSRFIQDEGQCLKCPKGGNCTDGIASRDNFWGYRDEKLIHFIPCPLSNCCSKDTIPCESFHTCGHNREGILCGSCKPSCTLNYFTDTCTQNSSCNRILFWCLYGFYACAIVIMLMYFEKFFLGLKRLWNSLKRNMESTNYNIMSPSEHMTDLTQPLLDNQEDTNLTRSSNQVTRRNSQDSEATSWHSLPSDDYSNSDALFFSQSRYNDANISQSHPSPNDDDANISQSHPSPNDDDANTSTTTSDTKDLINGFAKIVFFFYQAEHLLRVNSTIEKDYGLLTYLKYITRSIFNFRLESNREISLCPVMELNKPLKEIIKVSTPFLCFLIVFCLYLICSCICCKKRSTRVILQCLTGESPKEFKLRLKQCVVQLLLFGYANMMDFCLIMLNCVDVLGRKHLYYYGDLLCYTWWQTVIFVYFVTWILPFPLAVKFGVSMLRRRKISLRVFYFILLFPGSFIIFYINSKRKKIIPASVKEEQNMELHLLYKIFSGPFRNEKHSNAVDKIDDVPLTWDSVILARRLLLSIVCGLIINPVIRLFTTFPILVAIFILHITCHPFKLTVLNWAEIASLSLLLGLNTTNIFWAFSYTNNISDMPGFDLLATIFGIVEDVVLALPALCIIFILVGFFLKKVYSCCYKCCWRNSNPKIDNE